MQYKTEAIKEKSNPRGDERTEETVWKIYWFLEAGPTLASSQCWTKCYGLQLVHWSQWTKRAIYKFFCNSKFWFLITLYTFSGSIELLFYSIFFLHTMYKDSFVQIEWIFHLVIFNVTNSFVILKWKYTLMNMIMLYIFMDIQLTLIVSNSVDSNFRLSQFFIEVPNFVVYKYI